MIFTTPAQCLRMMLLPPLGITQEAGSPSNDASKYWRASGTSPLQDRLVEPPGIPAVGYKMIIQGAEVSMANGASYYGSGPDELARSEPRFIKAFRHLGTINRLYAREQSSRLASGALLRHISSQCYVPFGGTPRILPS